MLKYKLKFLFFWWLCLPHIVYYLLSSQKKILDVDIARWIECSGSSSSNKIFELIWLLLTFPEFRNVFYLRARYYKIFMFFLPPLSTLFINVKSKEFGPGVYIQHGLSTIIAAEHIGRNCWINQQVSIGYNDSQKYGYGRPWIGDNVRIAPGSKVCGKIKVGNNSTIGFNAVIVKDVPENSVIVPSPMQLIVEKGERCKKQF